MQHTSIQGDSDLNTICWLNNGIIDWSSAGKLYDMEGKVRQLGTAHYILKFDRAITSEDGKYVLIYQKLGTKGLLLKEGEILREINRPYYCSNAYEFPAVFLTLHEVTYLIHCPVDWDRLDFENAETGEIVTNSADRQPAGIFYSRLEISPNKTYLMSKGWVWHPVDTVDVFLIRDCLANPALLDNPQLEPDFGTEIFTASFIDDERVLIGSSNEIFDEEAVPILPRRHIAVWNLRTNSISTPVPVKEEFGNLFAIDEHLTWDLFGHPKIINIDTGEIVDEHKEINSGHQNSAMIGSNTPAIIFNRQTKQIAIKCEKQIEVFTP